MADQDSVTIRPARIGDARRICAIVNYWAERGRMLHRSLESVYGDLRDFLVACRGRKVVGCVSVSIFWADLAEIKSLAVDPHSRGGGVGSLLMKVAIGESRRLGIKKLFALTYEKEFFTRQGFKVIDRDNLPEKVWRECIFCPKVDQCDEIAMRLDLSRAARPRSRG